MTLTYIAIYIYIYINNNDEFLPLEKWPTANFLIEEAQDVFLINLGVEKYFTKYQREIRIKYKENKYNNIKTVPCNENCWSPFPNKISKIKSNRINPTNIYEYI